MTHSRLGYPFHFLTFCSKLIQYVRMMVYVVRLSPLEAIQWMEVMTASTSIVKLEAETVIGCTVFMDTAMALSPCLTVN